MVGEAVKRSKRKRQPSSQPTTREGWWWYFPMPFIALLSGCCEKERGEEREKINQIRRVESKGEIVK